MLPVPGQQLVGPKRRPVAGSQGLRLLRGIRLPAPQAGSQSVQASETDKDLRGTARCRIRCDRGLRVCRLTEDRWRNRARAFGRPSGPRTAWFAFCSPRPADVREGTSCRLHAHFPKCRHRPDPAAWSGDLCEEPVTFRGSSEDFREGVEAFGAKRKPRFRGNDAWRGDSRSLRGVAADGGPRVRIHLPPAASLSQQ